MAVNSKQKGKTFICQTCGKEFFVPQHAIDYRATIKFCSSECYHTSTRKPPKIKKCVYCGKEFAIDPKHKEKKFCNTKCACDFKRGRERKPTIAKSGYKYVWFSDGSGEREHRFIIEKQIGRKLTQDEVVHHIDGDRTNNDISNLVILKRGEHSKIHRKQEIEAGKKLFGG